MPSSHNLSRLDLERGALVFAQDGDHALGAREAGARKSWSPCGASLGPRTAHSHCHKQYLWKRVNTKSTRRCIFWGRALAICTEIRRRSRLCRLRGATHACSRARIVCLQVHAKPEGSQPDPISCKPERFDIGRHIQRVPPSPASRRYSRQVRSHQYDFGSLLRLRRYSFLLAMPNWTHASRGYEQTKFVSAQDGLATGISWRSSFFASK